MVPYSANIYSIFYIMFATFLQLDIIRGKCVGKEDGTYR
jgi:hypothetical protein